MTSSDDATRQRVRSWAGSSACWPAACLYLGGGVRATLIVAGTIAAELLGIFEGAAAGAIVLAGLLGWLVKFAVSEEKIWKYEHEVKAGKALVVVHGPIELAPKAKAILQKTNVEQLDVHAPVTT